MIHLPPGGEVKPPGSEVKPPGSKPPAAQSPLMELDAIRVEITKKRESFDEYLNKLRSEKSELFTGLSNLLDYCKGKPRIGRINFVSLVLACLDPPNVSLNSLLAPMWKM